MAPAALLIPAGRTYPVCSVPATKRWQPKREPSAESTLARPAPSDRASLRSARPFGPPRSVFARRRTGTPFPGPAKRVPRRCESRLLFNATVEDSIAVEETTEAGQSSEPAIAESPPVTQEAAAASSPGAKTERFKPRVPGQKARREDPAVPAEALVEGAVFTGKVTTIQPFGAFVNFGAFTDGLVHISKLSTAYVRTVSDIVAIGQEVKVTILSMEESSGRIALSMIDKDSKEAKEAGSARTGESGERSRLQQGADGRPINRGRIAGGRQGKRDEPQRTPTKFSKGEEVEGTVKNRMRSGVFVDLGNNEEGFLRVTEIPGGDNMAQENGLQTGEKIKATVLRIERGKVLLTMKPVVDILSVNRSINTDGDSGAANPFEIAFRAFNLVPAQEEVSVSEDVVEEASAVPEAVPAAEDSAPGPEEEAVIPEATGGFEETPTKEADLVPEAAEGAITQAAVATEMSAPAKEEVIPEAAITTEESAPAAEQELGSEVGLAVEEPSVPETEEVTPETSPTAAQPMQQVVNEEEPVPKVPFTADEVVAQATSTAVEEEIAAEPIPSEDVVPENGNVEEAAAASAEEVVPNDIPVLAEAARAVEEAIPEAVAAVEDILSVEESAAETAVETATETTAMTAAAVYEIPIVKDEVVVGTVPAVLEEELIVKDEVVDETTAPVEEIPIVKDEVVVGTVPRGMLDAAVQGGPAEEKEEAISKVEALVEEAISTTADASREAVSSLDEVIPETAAAIEESVSKVEDLVADVMKPPAPLSEQAIPEAVSATLKEDVVQEAAAAAVEDTLSAGVETVSGAAAVVEDPPTAEDTVILAPAAPVEEAPSPAGVVMEAAAKATVEEKQEEKPSQPISAALVKQLREETGAGMMDCKKALAASGGDLETARETLRKKGLASAEKKATRIASEGLIGSYVHDSRIGVLVEVNCETDFVSRGPAFKSLVEDVGMQVVASQQAQYVSVDDIPAEYVNKEKELEAQRDDLSSKPEAIRSRIVDGRVQKRLNEIALLEQAYIRDDKILVKDLVKQTVATLGENIKVRRFERYVLGEGLQKKSTDFAAEVAAQTAVKAPVEAPKAAEETPAPAPEATSTVVVSASLVKELRDQTGAGMMDCKKALKVTDNNLEKAMEFLRKKGLASAEKKSSRLASEGLIGTYVHDGRIGILIEVNCETDFVARGEKFKELVDDLAMQAAAYPQVQVVSVNDVPAEVVAKEKEMEAGKEDLANKPEAIRARIVDGRVAKRLAELSLEEQPFIRNDKKLVKDVVKETVASLGENIQIRRFTRFNLGEGLEKKVVDFAAEVAAQAGATKA